MAGMLAGLCAVLAVVLWERMAFAGLLDFAGVYRVEGTVSGVAHGRGRRARLPGDGDTVCRGVDRAAAGDPSLAVRDGAVHAGELRARGDVRPRRLRRLRRRHRRAGRCHRPPLAAAGRSEAAGASPSPRCSRSPVSRSSCRSCPGRSCKRGSPARRPRPSRARSIGRGAIAMMDAGVSTALFGMGLGSFPRTVLFKDHDAASATFSYAREGDNGFVRLGSGRPLFLEQRVSVAPGANYTLALDLRSAEPGGEGQRVALCEKSIQYSFRCKGSSFPINAAGTAWEHNEASFDAGRRRGGSLAAATARGAEPRQFAAGKHRRRRQCAAARRGRR